MPIVLLLLGGVVVFTVLEKRHQGISASLSISPDAPRIAPPTIQPALLPSGSFIDTHASQLTSAGISAGEQVGEDFAQAGSNIAKAIPIVGTVIGAIAGSLLAAHQRRKAEATDENSAMAKGVADVDQHIAAAFNYLNAGRISESQALALLDQAWANYWDIVVPHIQPGRNGCNSGRSIPPYRGGGVGSGGFTGTTQNAYYGCGTRKDWGAGCCAGNVLNASLQNCRWAIANPGKPAPVFKLFADKYGFPGRDAYQVIYQPTR